MAIIKGWTKVKLTGTINNRWEHRITKRTINIERYSPDKWFVNIRNSDWASLESSRSFNTKTEALAYAIKYMKRNTTTSGLTFLDKVPLGWKKVQGASTAPNGYSWYSNGQSRFNGKRKSALVKD